MIKKKIFIILFIIFSFNKVFAESFFIKYKINNEIVTNIDVKKEKRYLTALNPSLKQLDDTKLSNLAIKSIIREKIKEIELKKYFDLDNDKNNETIKTIIQGIFIKGGLDNDKKILNHLSSFNLEYEWITKKIKIETYWNNLIVKIYNNQVSIDKKAAQLELKKQIKKIKKKREIYISEILVKSDTNRSIEDDKDKILESINKNGFENTASIYSISNTSKTGGKIGWIEEETLSKEILSFVKNLKKNEISKFIKINNNYLLLKVDNVRFIEKNYDFEKILKKRIALKKNQQLQIFSTIYFEKVKQNTIINEQ